MIAIAVMIVGIGVAVAILYSGTGQKRTFGKEVRASSVEKILHAIPSDASLVACVSDAGSLFGNCGISASGWRYVAFLDEWQRYRFVERG